MRIFSKNIVFLLEFQLTFYSIYNLAHETKRFVAHGLKTLNTLTRASLQENNSIINQSLLFLIFKYILYSHTIDSYKGKFGS